MAVLIGFVTDMRCAGLYELCSEAFNVHSLLVSEGRSLIGVASKNHIGVEIQGPILRSLLSGAEVSRESSVKAWQRSGNLRQASSNRDIHWALISQRAQHLLITAYTLDHTRDLFKNFKTYG